MKPEMMLAKSEPKKSLLDHSREVAEMAGRIASELGYDKRMVGLCHMAGLLHDIGKAVSPAQEHLARNAQGVMSLVPGCNARHSAVGAWFISNHADTFDRIVGRTVPGTIESASDILCRAVGWHHKPYIPQEDGAFVYDERFDAEIKSFVDALIPGIEWGRGHEDDFSFGGENFKYFKKLNTRGQDNLRIHAVRSILIRADRLVSEGGSSWEIPAIPKLDIDGLECPGAFDASRFSMQKDGIAKFAIDSGKKTVVVNAPAGFGKTLIGLLSGLYRGEKMYWVVPRNVIADEVYRSISGLLVTLGLTGYTVNMVYGGEVKKGPETADITVTNIDAILQPMGQHGNMGHLCDTLGGTMVFDEYHELVGESPMWQAFLILLGARMGANGRNILISATPVDVLSCINVNHDEVLYLPGKAEHYPAQHSVPYTLNVMERMPQKVTGDTFAIGNSITRVQEIDCGLWFHSKYTDSDRTEKVDKLIESFGKGKENGIDGVSAGPILSTSLDLSCTHLYESVCSPMDTMQRIGRCNRFGDKEGCDITFITGNIRGDSDYVKMKFDLELRNLWCDALTAFVGKRVTLDEMYRIYDQFITDHYAQIQKWLRRLQQESLAGLVDRCAPFAIADTKAKKKSASGSGTIRNPEPNMYYIVPSGDGTAYYGPFSMDIATASGMKYGPVFNQVDNMAEYEKARKVAPEMVAGTTKYLSGGTRQKTWYKKNANKLARCSDCPFVVASRYMTYDSEKGIVFHGNLD